MYQNNFSMIEIGKKFNVSAEYVRTIQRKKISNKEVKIMSNSWTHCIVEMYCLYSSMSKKVWKTYDIQGNLKNNIENKNYIPPEQQPKWCIKHNTERIPQFKCLCLNCPYLAYTNCSKKEYKMFYSIWKQMADKMMENENTKHNVEENKK